MSLRSTELALRGQEGQVGGGHSEQGSGCGVLYLEAVCSMRFTFVGLLFPPELPPQWLMCLTSFLQVFQASLKLVKMIITQYIPKHKLSKLETTHCVERTVPLLLARTGDSSARLRVMALNFIQV